MRKGFEGLYGLARDRLLCEPLSGHVFVFANAQRKSPEAAFLGWKRAVGLREAPGKKGRFHWPEAAAGQAKVILSHEETALLLGGIDLAETRRRRWYRGILKTNNACISYTCKLLVNTRASGYIVTYSA